MTSSELTIKVIPKQEEPAEVIEVPKVETKVESKVEVKVEPKIAEPKYEPPKPVRRDFDLKDPLYKTKKLIEQQLLDICENENDYINFVNKNFKLGADLCLNLWFEQH